MRGQRSKRSGANLRLIVVVGAEVTGAVFAYRVASAPWARIDWGHLSQWIRTTSPDDAVVAVLRLAAIAGTAWLVASTAAYLLASVAHRPSLARFTGRLTLPAIRTLVDTALAASLIGGALGSGVAAYAAGAPPTTAPPVVIQLGGQPRSSETPTTQPPHAYVPVPAGDPPSRRSHPSTSAPPPTSVPTTTTTMPSEHDPSGAGPPPGRPAPPPAAFETSETTYTVQAGDNLWTIAAHHLADTTGRPLVRLGRGEIARYWLAVIDANRGKLPSGDPNLIHPGERVVLPALGG